MAVTGHCPKLAPEWNGNLDEVSATDLAAPGTGQSSLSPTIHATIQIQSRRHICNAQVFPVLLPKSPCTAPQCCGAAVSCCSLLLSQNPRSQQGPPKGALSCCTIFPGTQSSSSRQSLGPGQQVSKAAAF